MDSVNGASVTFTLTGVAMTPTSGQLNYKGTGNFDLAGTGSGDIVDK